jgi:uncharacterized hydrophobic protein (TIGR00271 family)
VLHLRLTVPSEDAPQILEGVRATAGVAHVAHLPGASAEPGGDLILCDVAREAAGALVDWLQEQRVHHEGAITITSVGTVISASADAAEAAVPGYGSDALVWEELEVQARENALLTPSFVVLMAIAGMIAGIGIVLDSPILIVGAMVVGPDYAPVSAVCVFAVRQRWTLARHALVTLVVALGAATLAAFVQAVLLDLTSIGPDVHAFTEGQLVSFISHPDALGTYASILAGIAGMLSLTEGRSSTLVGVVVSVTTIPAAANIGLAAALGEWDDMRGAAVQLLVNVVAILIAGVTTLVVQDRLTSRPARPGRLTS